MAEPKDTTSFFRKVVKFVANPATDWAELDAPVEDTRESDYAKGELKAMIERKRRNDFVRKREFDMLRKVRREGLTERAARRARRLLAPRRFRSRAAPESPARQDAGVKAKIDEIEQQMVGDSYASTQRRGPEFYNAPTQPAPIDMAGRPAAERAARRRAARRPGRGFRSARPSLPATIVKTRAGRGAARPRSPPIKLDLAPAERLRRRHSPPTAPRSPTTRSSTRR